MDTPQGMRQKLEAIETISKGLEARTGNRLFADLRYTEYIGGGHDAWTRAMNTAGLARWALRCHACSMPLRAPRVNVVGTSTRWTPLVAGTAFSKGSRSTGEKSAGNPSSG